MDLEDTLDMDSEGFAHVSQLWMYQNI
jgi:hypothetical protein